MERGREIERERESAHEEGEGRDDAEKKAAREAAINIAAGGMGREGRCAAFAEVLG